MFETSSCCDVVVPVHGSLDATDDCLRTVLSYTPLLARLIVVDDASDGHAAAWLDALAREDARVRVVRHERNLGFVRSANRGLTEATSPFVCILNSDTLVTPGWLEAMLRCAQSDPSIAVVNPVSNSAVNLTVQIAPGLDVFSMAEAVGACSRQVDPDVVTAVGFCFLVTRAALERFGGFDEAYGEGYCEESDYCMRVTGAGMRVVVADDAFVFHRGGASFGPSRARYLRNRRIFDERWHHRYPVEYDAFMRRDPLGYLRTTLESGLQEGAQLRAPQGSAANGGSNVAALGKLWLMTVDAWRKGGVLALARKVPLAPLRLTEAVQALTARLSAASARSEPVDGSPPFADPEQRRLLYATPTYTGRLPRGRGMRIGVLVWRFDMCGGVLAIVELVNRLVLAGHTVVLATLDERGMDAAFSLYAKPLVFRSAEDLAQGLPDLDLVVATFWMTAAEWLPAIRNRSPHTRVVYFVQDYEAWFVPPEDAQQRARVVDSYSLADSLIVTTRWLQSKVAEHGHSSTVIPYGIDRRVFYPGVNGSSHVHDGETDESPFRILVQARPSAPWRGFQEALVVLERLARRRSDIEVVFFGCTDDELASGRIRFPHRNAGVVSDRHAVARLYRECDVLFDPSRFQAFGLPGLEAMACGVPSILPKGAGTVEYAEHEQNTLLVDPEDVEGRVAALERVRDDAALRASLVQHGLATAARLTVDEMVRRHLEVYEDRVQR